MNNLHLSSGSIDLISFAQRLAGRAHTWCQGTRLRAAPTAVHRHDPLTPSGTSLTEGMAFSVGIGARQQVLLSTTLLDPRSARRSAGDDERNEIADRAERMFDEVFEEVGALPGDRRDTQIDLLMQTAAEFGQVGLNAQRHRTLRRVVQVGDELLSMTIAAMLRTPPGRFSTAARAAAFRRTAGHSIPRACSLRYSRPHRSACPNSRDPYVGPQSPAAA